MSTTAKEETFVLASSLPRLTGRPLDDFPSYVSIINAVATGIHADEGYVSVDFKALAASMQAGSDHIAELKELLRLVRVDVVHASGVLVDLDDRITAILKDDEGGAALGRRGV
jgi:hypothetical protein